MFSMTALRAAISGAAASLLRSITRLDLSSAPLSLASGRRPSDICPASRSKTYPEQSSRQAMRGSRRAQGGPGIVLGLGFRWVARSL